MIAFLVCPKCLESFNECRDYPSYHNRIRYVCPHCEYDGDSTEFETQYKTHPTHKNKNEYDTGR